MREMNEHDDGFQHVSECIREFLGSMGGADRYDPPYESPIEREFAWKMAKRLAPEVVLAKQFPVVTPWGRFRLDFVIGDGKRNVGVELDGREFHDAARDEWRDVAVLASAGIDAMYRIPGATVHHGLEDALWLFSRMEPSFFGDRERAILDAEISDGLRVGTRIFGDVIRWDTSVEFRRYDGQEPGRSLAMTGRSLSGPCVAPEPTKLHLEMACALERFRGMPIDLVRRSLVGLGGPADD